LTDTEKQNSTGKTQTKLNLEKASNAKYSKTKLLRFSCLLRHSARKRAYSATLLSTHAAMNVEPDHLSKTIHFSLYCPQYEANWLNCITHNKRWKHHQEIYKPKRITRRELVISSTMAHDPCCLVLTWWLCRVDFIWLLSQNVV